MMATRKTETDVVQTANMRKRKVCRECGSAKLIPHAKSLEKDKSSLM